MGRLDITVKIQVGAYSISKAWAAHCEVSGNGLYQLERIKRAERGQKARNGPELVSVQKESVNIAKDEKKKKTIMLITR